MGHIAERAPAMLVRRSQKWITATASIVVFLMPITATAHSFPVAVDVVNPPSEEADSKNAKLTFLTSRARKAAVQAGSIEAAQSIYYKEYLWHQTHLTICFWNGSEKEQREVMNAAATWTAAVPILLFDFEVNGNIRTCNLQDLQSFDRMSNIRINLDANDPRQLWSPDDVGSKTGDWAYPGPSVAQNPKYPTTMNLADVVEYRRDSRMTDYFFTIRHEFGHALGLVHEHQRQKCDGWFNIEQIAHDTGWSVQFTSSQVGALPVTSNAYGVLGGYDIDSIMQYNFQPSWYMPDRPGLPNPCRRRDSVYDLSETDKVVIDALYQPDLNKTPERVAFIDHAKAVAVTAPTTIMAAPSQRADIEQALRSFQSRIGRLEPISIQVFLHPEDKDIVLRAVKHLGYPLLDQSGRPIQSIGHPTEWLQIFSTNTLLFTSDVSPEDVRYVALALDEAGIRIRSIEPYYPSVNNGYTRRTHLIQIGAEIRNKTREPLSVDDILTKPLPMYGQTAQ